MWYKMGTLSNNKTAPRWGYPFVIGIIVGFEYEAMFFC